MHSLAIPIHDLDDQGKDYVFPLDQAWFARALVDTGVRGDTAEAPGEVTVHAQLNGREVLVRGQAHARLMVECGRCLKDFSVPVACELIALYAPQAAHGSGQGACEELSAAANQPDREVYTGDQVVLDDLVRDCLLLELPMQPSCDAGWDCPNLDLPEEMRTSMGARDPQPSGEEAIDPRLLPLLKLAKGGREKE